MNATVGDHLHVHRNVVGVTDTDAEIIEVRGTDGGPPYVVRFEDGHTGLVYPGPDAVVEHHPLQGQARGAHWEPAAPAQTPWRH